MVQNYTIDKKKSPGLIEDLNILVQWNDIEANLN